MQRQILLLGTYHTERLWLISNAGGIRRRMVWPIANLGHTFLDVAPCSSITNYGKFLKYCKLSLQDPGNGKEKNVKKIKKNKYWCADNVSQNIDPKTINNLSHLLDKVDCDMERRPFPCMITAIEPNGWLRMIGGTTDLKINILSALLPWSCRMRQSSGV